MRKKIKKIKNDQLLSINCEFDNNCYYVSILILPKNNRIMGFAKYNNNKILHCEKVYLQNNKGLKRIGLFPNKLNFKNLLNNQWRTYEKDRERV